MATSKPDILIILLQKLMEEGNLLYKVTWTWTRSGTSTFLSYRNVSCKLSYDEMMSGFLSSGREQTSTDIIQFSTTMK